MIWFELPDCFEEETCSNIAACARFSDSEQNRLVLLSESNVPWKAEYQESNVLTSNYTSRNLSMLVY